LGVCALLYGGDLRIELCPALFYFRQPFSGVSLRCCASSIARWIDLERSCKAFVSNGPPFQKINPSSKKKLKSQHKWKIVIGVSPAQVCQLTHGM